MLHASTQSATHSGRIIARSAASDTAKKRSSFTSMFRKTNRWAGFTARKTERKIARIFILKIPTEETAWEI
jgi:hypothetical protein